MKSFLFYTLFLITISFANAQDCDCTSKYQWVKETFENNDAGFAYAVAKKGKQAYNYHNVRIEEQVKKATSLSECVTLLDNWLLFFRSGHLGIGITENAKLGERKSSEQPEKIEEYPIQLDEFKTYLDHKENHDYEGIWETSVYKIAIKKVGNNYIGSIVASGTDTWKKDQVKLKFSIAEDKKTATFFMRDHSAREFNTISLTGKNRLHIGPFSLNRIYPVLEEDKIFKNYYTFLDSNKPYLEELNKSTLYLRIPSFQGNQKKYIDSVLQVHKTKILSTENLIIDIRNGTGGSDSSYKGLLSYLYTNPIREVGVAFLSTALNNERMLDLVSNPMWDLSDEQKEWAKKSYGKLQQKIGEFVVLSETSVNTIALDTIHAYPKQVAIIINQNNGSTDEQFLLAAKQSKKVKLFGTTTQGVLDISNMHHVVSPCKEIILNYALSKSLRLPDFAIDEIGIQPDYFIDKDIPSYKWVTHVIKLLNH